MNGEWCVFDKKFSKADCDWIKSIADTLPRNEAGLGVDGAAANDGYRKSQTSFIQRGMSEFIPLFDELWKLMCWSNNDWFNFHISKFDYIQYAEYNSANLGEYKVHNDVFYMNNDPFYHRKLSAVVQLTDPDEYEGGNFELYNLTNAMTNEQVAQFRNQGSVIVFPSFTNHAALPVTKGIRNSLAIWVDGPKWR